MDFPRVALINVDKIIGGKLDVKGLDAGLENPNGLVKGGTDIDTDINAVDVPPIRNHGKEASYKEHVTTASYTS